MENGKVLNLGQLAEDKKAKIKVMKSKKQYNELYSYANALPPTK